MELTTDIMQAVAMFFALIFFVDGTISKFKDMLDESTSSFVLAIIMLLLAFN